MNVPVTLVSYGYGQGGGVLVKMSVYKMQLSTQPCKHTCCSVSAASVGGRFDVILLLVRKKRCMRLPPNGFIGVLHLNRQGEAFLMFYQRW